jgi:hypothetical protein
MLSQPVSPLSGSPRTTQTEDNAGFPRFRVVASELTPLRAKVADRAAWLAGTGVAAALIIPLLKYPNPAWKDGFAAIPAYLLTKCATRIVIGEELKATTLFDLTVSQIKVRRGLRAQTFDRGIEHRFLHVPHDFVNEERARNDYAERLAQSKGRVIRKPVYYGNSIYIALEYGGQIFKLCEVFDLLKAEAILRRLRYCLECLDKAAKIGGASDEDHNAEWPPSPGGLQ